MKPQKAPVEHAGDASRRRMIRSMGCSLSAIAATVAPNAPRMNWPSTPMLNTPLRNEIATARPQKISGVAATSVSVIGRTAAAMARGVGLASAAAIRAGSPSAPTSIAPYALTDRPSAPPIAPTGSVPSFERFSKSVIRMKIEPTMNAVMIARIGTTRGPDRVADAAQWTPPISIPTFS